MKDDFIGKWGPEWTVAHEDKGEKGEEEEEDGRRRIVWFDVLTAITVKTTFFRDGSRALWQKNTPKKGEVVRFFEMLVPIYMHTHSAPHTGVHSSTPITDVVLCSDFLVPMYQTTRRHISDDTNPYLKLGFVYVCMCVCVCVCVSVTAFCEISGYSSGGVEVFALLGYYTVKVGIRLPTIQDSLSSSMDYLTAEDGTNRLDRNVGTKLPTCTS